ncbi:hypothetical protein MMPV_010193 [Pyropia vietnamensis]
MEASERVIPKKITPDDDTYKGVLDCESYALSNKSVHYDEYMAYGLGRKRKELSITFGSEGKWDGTPPLGVFEFLNRFKKACDDHGLSEGCALYLLPEFTQGDLKRELLSLLPSIAGGRTGEVTSYLEMVNWLLRCYAEEEVISSQVALYNAISQKEDETETAFYRRVRDANALCGYIHTPSQVKGRFMQGAWWEVRTDIREYNSASVPLEVLVRYAQRKGDLCRRRNEEQRKLRAAEDAERRARRAASRRLTAGVTDTPYGKPSRPAYAARDGAEPGVGGHRPPSKQKWERLARYPCLACNSLDHFTRNCPDLSVETRAKFAKARAERVRATAPTHTGTAGPSRVVAAVNSEPETTPEGVNPDVNYMGTSDDSPVEGEDLSENE